ncbi:accessory gene regulator B family protein [Desulfotruncus alcoholivorax]|uniref:accessory gene regulator B family protein n=1 Tax=Desulfotruncus alcoholivorax TaxID=265477 RepID=UPI000413A345|nr:accessory gene regulator B family protein [Desulfotruncus alcoholivorax]
MTSIISHFSRYLAQKAGNYTKNPGLNSEIFAYALMIILVNVTAFGGILLFSWLLGTIKATLLIWSAFISLRIFSGGRHQAGPVTCWALTVAVFTLLGFLVTNIAPFTAQYALEIEAAGFIFALYAVIAHAPVTIASKKFKQVKKSRLKTASTVVIIIWASFVFNPSVIAADRNPSWPLAITTGLVAQSFSILPLSFAKRH